MRPFEWSAPPTLDDALRIVDASSRPFAGGTDLLTLMKADLETPERLVAIRRLLPRGVRDDAGHVTIGAGTTLSEIERHEVLQERFRALTEATASAASAQLRNMATLGGNLLQRPRCWYFRSPHVQCWLKGGERCDARDGENQRHALFGDSPCVAVHPSDPAAALVGFDAHVRLASRRGERTLPLDEFLALPESSRRNETRLADDELVLDVAMPSHPAETRSTYRKAMDRATFAFALAGVAAVLRVSGRGRVGHARIVLSGVAPIPWRAREAEAVLAGQAIDEALIERAADAAVSGAAPLRHNGFKVPLVRALMLQALRSLAASPH